MTIDSKESIIIITFVRQITLIYSHKCLSKNFKKFQVMLETATSSAIVAASCVAEYYL